MNLWTALEDTDGLKHTMPVWVARSRLPLAVLAGLALRETAERSQSVLCANGCGRLHPVMALDGGRLVSICERDGWREIEVGAEEMVLWELDWRKLGLEIARAFDCPSRDADLGVPGARQVAAFGDASVPVVLTIQSSQEGLRSAVGQLVARLQRPFVLLAPTSRFLDGISQGLLANMKAGFFDLESHVSLTAQGKLQARKRGAELLARFLPEETEPVALDVARQAFRLLEQLDSEQVIKPPSVLTVFRLYCVQEMTAEQVAHKCRCSKGTVINRLRLIRDKSKMEPDELRRFSSQFDKIEDDIRESKAAYVHRKRLIEDSPSGEEGE